MEIKKGKFGSTELRISSVDEQLDINVILKCEEDLNTVGAVFVFLESSQVILATLHCLFQRGYKFLRCGQDSAHQVWYKWCNPSVPDKVPEHATAVAGCGVLILSPKEDQILLPFEYGKWKVLTGTVERGENVIETVYREIKEELNVIADPSFPIKFVGGFQLGSAREGNINDNCFCFIVKATSLDFKVDKFEIQKAQWFDISHLKRALAAPRSQAPLTAAPRRIGDSITFENEPFSLNALIWLSTFIDGKALNVEYHNATKTLIIE